MRKLFSIKMLQISRLPVEIRGFPGTGIFLCYQQLGLAYCFPKPVPLTNLKMCQKYAKLLYILRLLLQDILFCRKTKKTRKKKCLYCSTSETKQKCIITYVLTNLKTCNSINPWFVAFLRLPLSIQKYLIAYYTI